MWRGRPTVASGVPSPPPPPPRPLHLLFLLSTSSSLLSLGASRAKLDSEGRCHFLCRARDSSTSAQPEHSPSGGRIVSARSSGAPQPLAGQLMLLLLIGLSLASVQAARASLGVGDPRGSSAAPTQTRAIQTDTARASLGSMRIRRAPPRAGLGRGYKASIETGATVAPHSRRRQKFEHELGWGPARASRRRRASSQSSREREELKARTRPPASRPCETSSRAELRSLESLARLPSCHNERPRAEPKGDEKQQQKQQQHQRRACTLANFELTSDGRQLKFGHRLVSRQPSARGREQVADQTFSEPVRGSGEQQARRRTRRSPASKSQDQASGQRANRGQLRGLARQVLFEDDEALQAQLVELLAELYAHTQSLQARFGTIWRRLVLEARLSPGGDSAPVAANQSDIIGSVDDERALKQKQEPGNRQATSSGQSSSSHSARLKHKIKMQLGAGQDSLLEWLRERQEKFPLLRNVTIMLISEPPNKTINVCDDGPKILVMPNVSDIFYCYTREQWTSKLWSDLRFSAFHYPFLLLNILIFVFGTFGNMFVCLSVKRNHQLRSVTNYFIVNLAFADFLVILICLPATVVWDLSLTWFFDTMACKSIMFLQDVSISVSVLTLTAISIDRYYAVCHPLRFKSNLSQAKRIIGLIWAVSLLIMAPDLVYLSAKPSADITEAGLSTVLYSDCNYDWSNQASRAFQFVKTVLLYLVPFLLMFCAHFRILAELRQTDSSSSSATSSSSTCQHQSQLHQVARSSSVNVTPQLNRSLSSAELGAATSVQPSGPPNEARATPSSCRRHSSTGQALVQEPPSRLEAAVCDVSQHISAGCNGQLGQLVDSVPGDQMSLAQVGAANSSLQAKQRVRFQSSDCGCDLRQSQRCHHQVSGGSPVKIRQRLKDCARLGKLLHGASRFSLAAASIASTEPRPMAQAAPSAVLCADAEAEAVVATNANASVAAKSAQHQQTNDARKRATKPAKQLDERQQSWHLPILTQPNSGRSWPARPIIKISSASSEGQAAAQAAAESVSVPNTAAADSPASTLVLTVHNQSQHESRRNAAKMLTAIVVLFGICYLPVHLINFLRQFIEDIPQTDVTSTISMLAHCICYLNSAINPIIYNHMNSVFRAEFRKFLSCFYERCPKKNKKQTNESDSARQQQLKFRQQLAINHQQHHQRHASLTR